LFVGEKLDEVSARLKHSHQKCPGYLSQEIVVTKTFGLMVTDHLKLKAYKTTFFRGTRTAHKKQKAFPASSVIFAMFVMCIGYWPVSYATSPNMHSPR
jgi:ABC-type Mn2+/Zn2+ transport system ATPase subunit